MLNFRIKTELIDALVFLLIKSTSSLISIIIKENMVLVLCLNIINY